MYVGIYVYICVCVCVCVCKYYIYALISEYTVLNSIHNFKGGAYSETDMFDLRGHPCTIFSYTCHTYNLNKMMVPSLRSLFTYKQLTVCSASHGSVPGSSFAVRLKHGLDPCQHTTCVPKCGHTYVVLYVWLP